MTRSGRYDQLQTKGAPGGGGTTKDDWTGVEVLKQMIDWTPAV